MALVHRGRIVGFFLVGVISSLVDLGLLYCCTEYLGIWYLASAAASYCCGMLVNYGLNKHLNFRDGTGYTVRQFSLFALVSMSSLLLNMGILLFAVEVFAVHYLAGKIAAMTIAFFWNYLGQSSVTFRLR